MQSSESMLPDKPGNNRRSLRVLLFIGAAVILALILIGLWNGRKSRPKAS